MKESGFVQQNKEKWLDFEDSLNKKKSDPKKTSRYFIQITDDLSYARTFYKNRSVRSYLNGISKLLFNSINRREKTSWKDIARFWKTDLPLTMYASRRAMLISNIVFWGCFALGIVSSIADPDFAQSILGADYIQMTDQNIEDGKPMAVYDDDDPLGMFWYIMMNNLRVDLMTFSFGLLSSIGTILIMISNGVMVGVFQYYFIEKGVFWESFLGIWTHGTIEISTIILMGGAGIELGKGLLFPGTYSRFQAFRMSGRQGLKIMMGVLPLTVFAAFIESFVTRHTDVPDPIRLGFILLCFSFIVLYFIWYPRWLAKRTPNLHSYLEFKPIVRKEETFDRFSILTVAEIFAFSVRTFIKRFSVFALTILGASLCVGALVATNSNDLFYNPERTYTFRTSNLFDYDEFPVLGLTMAIIHFLITTIILMYAKHIILYKKKIPFSLRSSNFGNTALAVALSTPVFIGLVAVNEWWAVLLGFLILPLLNMTCSVANHTNTSFFASVGLTASLLNRNWWKLIGATLLCFIIWVLLFTGNNFLGSFGFIPSIISSFVSMLTTNDGEISATIETLVKATVETFNYLVAYSLSLVSYTILYFTLKESNTAEHLISRIKNIVVK